MRNLVRDAYRRSLATHISSVANGVGVGSLAYTYDALNRPTRRNDDTFGYNARGEVTCATIAGGSQSSATASYNYDAIGNLLLSAFNATTNAYTANSLNQYTSILRASAPPCEPTYDLDGNMTQFGAWTYTYDAANRLASVALNGVPLVSNIYDAKSRRVRKVTSEYSAVFFYDGWNLVEERVAYTNGTASTIHYYWGKDLSGTLRGAGGVGGLLYLTVDGDIYIPCYDVNGNVTRYLDSSGNTVAAYTYDAFGCIVSQAGSLADIFRHRFSTKYHDAEIGLCFYGYRFYNPILMRWLNRDPIEENGGFNIYSFCCNNAVCTIDPLGQDRYMTTFSFDPRKDQLHVGVAVDTWKCSHDRWVKTGVATFDFGVDDSSFWNRLGTFFATLGGITESSGNSLENSFTIPSTPEQDIEMLRRIRAEMGDPSLYSFFFNNCIHWANKVIEYGMDR